jgi:hypothetical protein
MLAEYLRYALLGLAIFLVFVGLCFVFIRYEQTRRRALEKMTPEERKEAKVFQQGVFRRR